MKTITFDFDDTLSTKPVQQYAKKLIDSGYHVMIVTSRIEDKLKHLHPFSKSNADLYSVAKKLGISKENIKFTNRQSKSIKLPSYNSSVHLENDPKELMDIRGTKVKGIDVTQPGWEERADKAIKL